MTWRWVVVMFGAGCSAPSDGPRIIVDAHAVTVDDAAVDAALAVDARLDAGTDGAMVTCTAASTYGATPLSESAGTTPDSIFYLGRLDPTSMPDFLQLTLYDGYGAFTAGITAPTTVQLVGEELAFATCGACIFLFTDLHAVGADVEVTDYYMPTGGTVELTSVTGRFQGTITNLTMQHMIISGQDLVPANDGCNVTIPSLAMDALIE